MRDLPAGPGSPPTGGLHGVLVNPALIAGLLGCMVAQIAKVFTHQREEKVWDWSRALSSGGMPSSHTALVVAATSALGILYGTGSGIFALALIVSLVVAYDACGVRLHASRHAMVLNALITELPPEHPVAEHPRLHDMVGHTHEQVLAGAGIGVLVGLLIGSLAAVGQQAGKAAGAGI